MLIITVRTVIIYFVILFAVRLMGKSELSKMSAFQMVVIFMIAELGAIPIDDPSLSLLNGMISICTLIFLQVLISWLSTKSEFFKNIITGAPSILIDGGRINIHELKQLRITLTDFMEQLRIEGYPSPNQIQYAIMESNGQLSIIPKDDKNHGLPLILVSDGTLYPQNFDMAKISENKFKKKLQEADIDDLNDVFLSVFDEKGKVRVYLYSEQEMPYALEVKI